MTNQNTLRLPGLVDVARPTRDHLRAIRTFLVDPDGMLTLHGHQFTDADAPEATR
jgi:hypothetical protein